MKSHTDFVVGMVVLPIVLLAGAVVLAGSVATPNTFVAGTPAVASEVNANFAAHAAEINDNDARITANATAVANKASVVSSTGAPFVNVPTGNEDVLELDSVTINAPSSGSVLVMLTGYTVFFADGKEVAYAVADNNTTFPTAGTTRNGRLDGAGTDRFERAFAVMNVFPVTAGSHTFYALAKGRAVFGTGVANVVPETLTALFIAN